MPHFDRPGESDPYMNTVKKSIVRTHRLLRGRWCRPPQASWSYYHQQQQGPAQASTGCRVWEKSSGTFWRQPIKDPTHHFPILHSPISTKPAPQWTGKKLKTSCVSSVYIWRSVLSSSFLKNTFSIYLLSVSFWRSLLRALFISGGQLLPLGSTSLHSMHLKP